MTSKLYICRMKSITISQDFSASEVLDNHKSVLTSLGIQSNSKELDLPYIIGFRRCTKIHINIDSLQVHRSVGPSLYPFYSQNCLHIFSKVFRSTARQPTQKVGSIRCGSSRIQKNYLDHLISANFNLITNIKSFDFSSIYTTIPHQKLKSRLETLIQNSFLHKYGNRRYKYLVSCREGPYFEKEHSDSMKKYTAEDIIKMLEFLVNNIFVIFAGKVFQQIIGIPMGTNCAPLLVDIFLYYYEAEFIQSLLSAGKKRLASQFNFTYRYIDDVLSIYSLLDKETSFLELNIKVIGSDIHTIVYDKRFGFPIVNFPWLSGDVPRLPSYGIYISQVG